MGKPLDPTIKQTISLPDAAAQTRAFRRGKPSKLGDSVAFNADPVKSILSQPGCVGIRCYRALAKDGSDTLVLVGVDANGDDMTAGILVNNALPCPPFCSGDDALNT